MIKYIDAVKSGRAELSGGPISKDLFSGFQKVVIKVIGEAWLVSEKNIQGYEIYLIKESSEDWLNDNFPILFED